MGNALECPQTGRWDSTEAASSGGGGWGERGVGAFFHLRMSEKSDSSSARSMIPCAPLGPWPPAFTRAWAFRWPLVPLSPLDARELSLWSESEWASMSPRPAAALLPSPGFFSGPRMASPCTAEVQKLRMEQRLPQFCSHWAWTLLVIAFFTSSPQVSRIFTRSTYGLEVKETARAASKNI